MKSPTGSTVGALLLIAGAVIVMGIITAETQYPDRLDYSTAGNEISDLGATRPPNSVVTHPSSEIFNATMLAAGAMIATAGVLSRRANRRRVAPYVLSVFGVAVFLVGIFPGNHAAVHPVVAMGAFVLGGMSCITSARLSRGPMRYVSVALGVTTLTSLVLAGSLTTVLGSAAPSGGSCIRWSSGSSDTAATCWEARRQQCARGLCTEDGSRRDPAPGGRRQPT